MDRIGFWSSQERLICSESDDIPNDTVDRFLVFLVLPKDMVILPLHSQERSDSIS